jgi:hypothetical protein
LRLLGGLGGANRLVVRRRLLDRVEREGLPLTDMPARATVRKRI